MTAPQPGVEGADRAARPRGDVAIRIVSSLVLIPIALVGTWWGSWPAYCLVALVSAIVFAEWTHVVDQSKTLLPDSRAAMAGLVFVALAAIIAGVSGAASGLALALVGAAGVGLLSRSAWLASGTLYAALLGVSLSALRSDPEFGLSAVIVLLVVVWASDSFAFFAGRTIGGPKLWPRISPKKTWSGSIGGLVGGVLASLVAAALLGIPVTAGLVAVLVGLSIVSALGDLFESALKRRFHKKDSSHIIPGHGGMMDRVDGLLFASVVALFIGWAHAGSDAIGRGVLLW